MLTPAQREAAARGLVQARRARQSIPRLVPSCRPGGAEDGWLIQRRVQALLALPAAGWKCSLPTPARPIACAAILAPTVARVSPYPMLGRRGAARIEPEIAFVLGRDLPPRAAAYDEAEVRAAVVETRLVLELLESRFSEPAALTFPEQLADHLSNQGLFVGPLIADGLSQSLAGFPIAIETATAELHACAGQHPDGHPLRPLHGLANDLASRPEVGGLKAGDIVTTGSYAGAFDVPLGMPLRVQFGELGEIRVTFVAT